MEVWTRFMRVAHQGVAVASLPASQASGLLSPLARIAAQVSAPSPIAPLAAAPAGASGASRTAPARGAPRPQASAGLDGWLVDRLFGR